MPLLPKFKIALTICILYCLGSYPGLAVSAAVPAPPAVPKIAAKSFLLMDFQSGRFLAEKDLHMQVEPASITKVMSSYVVFKALKKGSLKLEDEVLISKKAWKTQGSKMFIEVGKKVKVEDLIKGMVVQSGNDATIALAEQVGGSEEGFVKLMNQYAQELGLKDSQFANSTGWPEPNHYMSANDIALLTRAMINEFPNYYPWHALRQFGFNKIIQYNRNKLLWRDESVDGVKTGHTETAGYCLVASALKDNMRLITVVLGAASDEARATESMALLNYGYKNFETRRIYAANAPITKVKVWKGALQNIDLGISRDLYITIPKGRYDKLNSAMVVKNTIIAPVKQGTALGNLNITLDNIEIATMPAIALQDVDLGGLWQRWTDGIKLWLQ